MNEKTGVRFPLILYGAVWLFCVGWFWLGADGGGWIMAYTILTLGVLMPLAALISAFMLANRRALGGWFWGVLAGYGVLNLSVIAATFTLGTAIQAVNIAPIDAPVVVWCFIPGTLGLALGWLFRVRGWSVKWALAVLLALLVACWIGIKSLAGSVLRWEPLLDLPLLAALILGVWFLFRRGGAKTQA